MTETLHSCYLAWFLISSTATINHFPLIGAAQSRSGCSQIPPAQPAPQRRKQRGRRLQLQHTTQLLIYADQTSLNSSFKWTSSTEYQQYASCLLALSALLLMSVDAIDRAVVLLLAKESLDTLTYHM